MIEDCHIIKVDTNDIGNGPGIRVTVWVAGCIHQCAECHNPETWKWKQGVSLTDGLIARILDACDHPHISGLSLSGGDPMFVKNREGITKLCKAFRKRFDHSKSIWMWTGYLLDDIQDEKVLKYLDVVVDGKYVANLRNIMLPYCGSTNQKVIRIIDGKMAGIITDHTSPLLV